MKSNFINIYFRSLRYPNNWYCKESIFWTLYPQSSNLDPVALSLVLVCFGMRVHRVFHLLDKMLVATASTIQRLERMWARIGSGRVLIMSVLVLVSAVSTKAFCRAEGGQLSQDLALTYIWLSLSFLPYLLFQFYASPSPPLPLPSFHSSASSCFQSVFSIPSYESDSVCVCFALRKWVSTVWTSDSRWEWLVGKFKHYLLGEDFL